MFIFNSKIHYYDSRQIINTYLAPVNLLLVLHRGRLLTSVASGVVASVVVASGVVASVVVTSGIVPELSLVVATVLEVDLVCVASVAVAVASSITGMGGGDLGWQSMMNRPMYTSLPS